MNNKKYYYYYTQNYGTCIKKYFCWANSKHLHFTLNYFCSETSLKMLKSNKENKIMNTNYNTIP